MNIEKARINMIESQIRAGGVHSRQVLDLFEVVKREHFAPSAYRSLAFSDMEIPLLHGENMLTPRMEGLVLEAAAVKRQDRILEIGSGSGYMAALLAQRALQVTTVEIEPELKALAEKNLNDFGIFNVDVMLGNGAQGWEDGDETYYDVIVISGSLRALPDAFLRKLGPDGRLVAFIGEAPFIKAQLIRRRSHSEFDTTVLFETTVKPLLGQAPSSLFRF
jgi:protein-L-isoaspartate(D-aspartate) O-methyltransferase